MSFAELIRAGNAQGVLRAEWPTWPAFPRHSNADDAYIRCGYSCAVVAEIPAFLEEAEYLCAELNKRQE